MVLDPPWENASARRAWRYPTLPSRNLLAIPMRRLLQPVSSMNCVLVGHAGFKRCMHIGCHICEAVAASNCPLSATMPPACCSRHNSVIRVFRWLSSYAHRMGWWRCG